MGDIYVWKVSKVKKYLLLIEDEKIWEKFKEIIDRDINTELINLVKAKVSRGGKNEK
tara:strand:- start:278 stop:448 length:171 start_codon:yes stop_codon:yes gene_type:complete